MSIKTGNNQHSFRLKNNFVLVCVLFLGLVSKSVGALEEYHRGWDDWQDDSPRNTQTPLRMDPNNQQVEKGGNFRKVLFTVGSFATGFLISKLWNRKTMNTLKEKQRKQMDLIWQQALSEKERQMQSKNAEITKYQEKYQEAEQYFQQLSQLVYEAQVQSEMEQLQVDYKEFSEPDANADGYISRNEFNAYLQQAYKKNPSIPLSEYPTFDDFEQNGDGMVSFEEWRYYLNQLEQQAALQAQLQEYYAQVAQQQQAQRR
mmetsp:Transcript_4702/g.6460  ORF Transcript_4702/g.6460 Transcript_4702/m.6460 type:complete len:259 (+) Transcript_4702:61-837(+)